MGRRQPKIDPPEVKKWDESKQEQEIGTEKVAVHTIGGTKVIVQQRQYKLITPLFGGGVEPGVNDLDNLIRATEIRGQLRFWWRAIRGGQPEFEGDIKKMKAREDEIWGAASKVSKRSTSDEQDRKQEGQKWSGSVQIEVKVRQQGQPVKPFKIVSKRDGGYKAEPGNGIPGYAAFPLRPEDEKIKRLGKEAPIDYLQQNIGFDLNIAFYTEYVEDVLAALWAWETFGGVGARTRRGFGALQLQKIDATAIEKDRLPPADPNEAKIWIRDELQHHLGSDKAESPKHVPHLEPTPDMPNMHILGPYKQPANAWNEVIDPLSQFRQKRFDFRQQRPSQFGKSLWPEANALRRRLHTNQKKVNTPDTFPRAAFGLPIVFHMAHERPVETITLQSAKEEGERLASRLILKPIPCRGKQFLGLAIILDGSDLPEEGLVLMHNEKKWEAIPSEQTELKTGELPLLKDVLGEETDILMAFMNYLRKKKEK